MMSTLQITKLTNYRVRLVLKADAYMCAVHTLPLQAHTELPMVYKQTICIGILRIKYSFDFIRFLYGSYVLRCWCSAI